MENKNTYDIPNLLKGIQNKDKRALSKALTLVESSNPDHQILAEQLVDELQVNEADSKRIGITGTPGAGKSTFIDSFGNYLVEKGMSVAVLAIDPSSTETKGSILGDKTRMEKLSVQENAFVRPSPSKGYYGGVAVSTYESIQVLEAFGFDVILIETVGVGQSETMIVDLVDMLLMITVSGGGDGLQGIKRGIMEHIDLVFINKVDEEPRAEDLGLYSELQKALSLLSKTTDNWKVEVLMGSSINNKNIDLVWDSVEVFYSESLNNNRLEKNRINQNKRQFQSIIQRAVWDHFLENSANKSSYNEMLQRIEKGEKIPLAVIRQFIQNMG